MRVLLVLATLVFLAGGASWAVHADAGPPADDSCVRTSPTASDGAFPTALYDRYRSTLFVLFRDLRAGMPADVIFPRGNGAHPIYCIAIVPTHAGSDSAGLSVQMLLTAPFDAAATTLNARAATALRDFGLRAIKTIAASKAAADPDIRFVSLTLGWPALRASNTAAAPQWELVTITIPQRVSADFLASRITAQEMLDRSKLVMPTPDLPSGQSIAIALSDAVAPRKPDEAVARGGCIGETLETCVRTLQARFRVAPGNPISEQIRQNAATDANGKRLHKKFLIVVTGTLPGFDDIKPQQTVVIEYSAEGIVQNIEITLPADPAMARTTEEFDATGLYEGMALLIGLNCPEATRHGLYAFFQNDVRGRIAREAREMVAPGANAAMIYSRKAVGITFCDRRFSYVSRVESDAGTNARDRAPRAKAITMISVR
jgi:hypothetical protein